MRTFRRPLFNSSLTALFEMYEMPMPSRTAALMASVSPNSPTMRSSSGLIRRFFRAVSKHFRVPDPGSLTRIGYFRAPPQ